MGNVLPHILEKDKFYEKSVFLPVQDLFWARDYLSTSKIYSWFTIRSSSSLRLYGLH